MSIDPYVFASMYLSMCTPSRVVHFVYTLCVSLSMCCPPPGNFDLFSTSNGTSKEDFSEFDSLRSSSSVPTGTHPVFVALMTRSLCCFPLCSVSCLVFVWTGANAMLKRRIYFFSYSVMMRFWFYLK